MEVLESISAGIGLDVFGSWGPTLAGVLLVLVAVKILELPFKLVWNGIFGAAILFAVNFLGAFIGFGMKVTVVKALIAGFFGIPGAAAVVLWEVFSK